MAVGDIVSITIAEDGWSALIHIDQMGTGGAYDLGFNLTEGSPSNLINDAKIVLNVTSAGYDDTGTPTTRHRTIYGTKQIRKPYPDQATMDEAAVGPGVLIKIALSDYIYSDCTNITATMAAGVYNKNSVGSNAVIDFPVTNSSALNFPKVVGNWAWPGQRVVTGDFALEFAVFSGFAKNAQQVACVKFIVTDEHSNSDIYVVTQMSISPESDVNTVIVYSQTVDVSGFVDGDMLTVDVQAYPLVGNNTCIIDTTVSPPVMPTPLCTSQKYRLDKSNLHGHCCIDTVNGNDGTGTVYASQNLAEAGNAYATISAALTALQAYHNSNAGHNDAGGGTIYFAEGTYTVSNWQGGTLTQWVTFTRRSDALKSAVNINPASPGYIPTYLRLYDVTVGGTGYFNGESTKSCWTDSCNVLLSSPPAYYRFKYNIMTHCTGGNIGLLGDSISPTGWHIVRGNDFNVFQYAVTVSTLIGNNNALVASRTVDPDGWNNGRICAYNTVYDNKINTGGLITFDQLDVDGLAIVQNLVETSDSAQPIIRISGDGSTNTTNNIIIFNNTFVGQRGNMGYNDTATGGPYPQTNWFVKNSLFTSWNNKDDTHMGNPDATGSWPVGYHVNSNGNVLCSGGGADAEWLGEFYGLNVVTGTIGDPVIPAFVDNASRDGTTLGNGDYRPVAGSVLINLTSDELLPYDIEGNDRSVSHVVGAYCFSQSFNNGNIFYRMLNNV